jgi:signal transduction histidine kinase
MLAALVRRVRLYASRKAEDMPGGYTWPFVISIDVTMVAVSVIAAAQRPPSLWWIAGVALAVGFLPYVVFFAISLTVPASIEAGALWLSWTASAAILLFGTPTPIDGDFAPLLLGLLTGMVGSFTSLRGGIFVAASAAALLGVAAALDHVRTPWMYLSFIGIGLLVGYLMRTQQQLLLAQRQAQQKLAEHAAADERRRIAREVHDVIAHSLSVTLLHVTGARRELQEDREVDEAVEALEQAERLGRQAMADIRRTVGLLDDAVGKVAPEPGVGDIGSLVEDFVRAGLAVTFTACGREDAISAAAGLALYRIAQESLANIAKHAPDTPSEMTLAVSPTVATLTVANRLPVPVTAPHSTEGRGMRGMRQRVELLGGRIEAGPNDDNWTVRAVIPVGDDPFCGFRGRGR